VAKDGNELTTSANVSPGPKCAKLGLADKIQRGVGKSQVKKRKYDGNYGEVAEIGPLDILPRRSLVTKFFDFL
jgi:hypothetical protein